MTDTTRLPLSRVREIYRAAKDSWCHNADGDIHDIQRYRVRIEQQALTIESQAMRISALTNERDEALRQSHEDTARYMQHMGRADHLARELRAAREGR